MAGNTAFPGALDTTTTLPVASTLAGIELDGDGTANNIHSNVHGVENEAIVAVETKLGSGATTPTATAVLVGSGSGTSAWDTTPTFGAVTITDNLVLGIGTNNDGAIVNRTTVLNANTALTGVTIGTPVTPAVAQNSTIVSNITASGDILVATNRGGNSEAHLWLDGSAGDTYLYARGVQMIKLVGGGGVEVATAVTMSEDLTINAASGQAILSIESEASATALNLKSWRTSGGNESALLFQGSRGTSGSPAAVQSGDRLAYIQTLGRDNDAYSNGFEMYVNATETWDASGNGVDVLFKANTTGDDTIATRLSIPGTGGVGIPVGNLYIGDTANAQMAQGVTINQGAADNEALALKSSDVIHAFISSGYTTPETDTYFQIMKQDAGHGGTTIASTAEDAAMTGVLTFYSQGGTATTTHSASGVGLVDFLATEHNGAAHLADPSGVAIARANLTADGIVYSFRGRVGGANSSLFLIDEDGDTWQGGGATFGGDLTIGGNITMGDNRIIIDSTVADGTVSGITTTGTAGSSMVVGDVIVLSADNAWDPANADSAAADALGTGMLGIALTAASSGSIDILLQGFVMVSGVFEFSSAGLPLYLDDTAGDMSQTAPSASGDFVRIVGYAHDDNDTIYFNPDNTWVEVA